MIQHKNFNFKAHFLFSKKCKGGTLDKNFLRLLQNLTGHCTKVKTSFELKIFFHIIWAPYYWFSKKILILKLIFYFQKSVKRGTLTKTFPTPANFNRPLHQSQDFIRTLNIFTYYLSSLLLIQLKKFNFKALFYFQKSVHALHFLENRKCA